MKTPIAGALSICLASLITPAQTPPDKGSGTSELWGSAGERWTPQSRLPDFSFAGYRSGEPIPNIPVALNVKDFGAKGDGTTDDTAAFLQAIERNTGGAILIPPGRYKITQPLRITKSNVVLRGAGPEKTILFCPLPLSECVTEEMVQSWVLNKPNWSFKGGMIWVESVTPDNAGGRETRLASVTQAAKRGDHELIVSSTEGINADQFVRVIQREQEPNGPLTRHLMAGKTQRFEPANIIKWTGGMPVNWAVKVQRVSGNKIVLERPLRIDVRPEWTPEIHAYRPPVQEVGIESLGFEFPNVPYAGHLREKGYNAIHFLKAVNCWIRDVIITDADTGVFLEMGTRYCTVAGVRLRAHWRKGITGHHGIEFDGSQDCFATRIEFETMFLHDFTVQALANGNVASKSKGVDINFDHHGEAPYENLFSDIDIGLGTRPWESSGRNHSGARETFWNIRARQAHSRLPHWPQVNIVGYQPSDWRLQRDPDSQWIEIVRAAITPADIHQAQFERRSRFGADSRKSLTK